MKLNFEFNLKIIIPCLIVIVLAIIIYRIYFDRSIEYFQNPGETLDSRRASRVQNSLDMVETSLVNSVDKWNNIIREPNVENRVSVWKVIPKTYLYRPGDVVVKGFNKPSGLKVKLIGGDVKSPIGYRKIATIGEGAMDRSWRTNLDARITEKQEEVGLIRYRDNKRNAETYNMTLKKAAYSDIKHSPISLAKHINLRDITRYRSDSLETVGDLTSSIFLNQSTLPGLHNQVSSLSIPIGVQVTFYKGYNFNDKWGSLVIGIAGWKKVMGVWTRDRSKQTEHLAYKSIGVNGFDYTINNLHELGWGDSIDSFRAVIHPTLVAKLNDDYTAEQERINALYPSDRTAAEDDTRVLSDLQTELRELRNQLNNKPIFALTAWRPIAPKGYVALGDVLTNSSNTQPRLDYVKCVPRSCVKRKEWSKPKHKTVEFRDTNKNITLSFYKNEYTHTTCVSTSASKPPELAQYKLIPCIKTCSQVDEIIEADNRAQKFCKKYKKPEQDVVLVSNEYDNEESKRFQSQIRKQEKVIRNLKQTANGLKLENHKYDAITKIHNRTRLSGYLQDHKDLIDEAIEKLRRGGETIDFNVNVPRDGIDKILDFINKVIAQMAKKDLPPKINDLIKQYMGGKLSDDEYKRVTEQILASCPQINMDEYIKKDPPCYGCFGV